MIHPMDRLHAAARFASHGVTMLADAIAPPISVYASPERRRAICPDPDHAEEETRCPTCGQGPPGER
jgi:hypothetical protein